MRIEFWADREKRIPNPEIFSQKAAELSEKLAKDQRKNKRTQLRRFYDELLRLDQDARQQGEEKWPHILARVHLLIPKAAYAERRGLVSKEFVEFIKSSVLQTKTKEDLGVFATLFEAIMGFYNQDRPRDN